MKKLVLYYTRTGVTKVAAETVAKILECDISLIVDKKKRLGAINYIIAGKDALREIPTEIEEPDVDLKNYDLVIFGTPVWAGNVAPAIRTYINAHKNEIKNFAFFATQGASGVQIKDDKFVNMCGKSDFKSVWIRTKDVKTEKFSKLNDFCKELDSK